VIEPVANGAAQSGAAAGAAAPSGAAGSAGATRSADAVSRGFEQLLVEQLAKELLKTTGDTGNAYASLLPTALADAVQDGGGLGLDIEGPSS
jgi:hypothetical protein